MVRDINPGGESGPEYLTALGKTLYFSADDGVHGRELWASDGTREGTYLVKDIDAGPGGGLWLNSATNFEVLGGPGSFLPPMMV